jgi:hypothetical protein
MMTREEEGAVAKIERFDEDDAIKERAVKTLQEIIDGPRVEERQ